MKNIMIAILAFAGVAIADKPNILWITSEDNGISWVSCYGSKNTQTPTIDNLAKEGFRYTHCFDNAAVCAPTRSTWITGMHAVSTGTQPMRSRNEIPHDRIRYYPDALKEAGYFVANCRKTDYNIGGRKDDDPWDALTPNAWSKRKDGQPFFCVMNLGTSHEAQAHRPYVENEAVQKGADKMTLHSYHPDLPQIRNNYLQYANAIKRMDGAVKRILDQLKNDGLYEDTIIVYCSDHGGVIPRSKRFLYSAGIHCPLVIRIPEKYKELYPAEKPGMVVDRLVSFVDMPKTWVSLAGAKIPKTFQGAVFLGKGMEPEPEYHFAFRERADERLDCVRVMRGKQFAYHKNYMPYAPAGQYLGYLWKCSTAPAWELHHRAGLTDEITGRFFRPRVSEEFYDTYADFDNVHNLIDDPKHQAKIAELKQAMRKKQLELFDSGLLPEEMRNRRAQKNNLTLYEMVRDPKLYPLSNYLDASDLALERNVANVKRFKTGLSHADAGIRWWSVIGLLLLEKDAASATEQLQEALNDSEDEIKMMAAWSLIKIGEEKQGLTALETMLRGECDDKTMLCNLIDWMGESGLPLLKIATEENLPKQKDGRLTTMLKHVAKINGL